MKIPTKLIDELDKFYKNFGDRIIYQTFCWSCCLIYGITKKLIFHIEQPIAVAELLAIVIIIYFGLPIYRCIRRVRRNKSKDGS